MDLPIVINARFPARISYFSFQNLRSLGEPQNEIKDFPDGDW